MNSTLTRSVNPALQTKSTRSGPLYPAQNRRTLAILIASGVALVLLVALGIWFYFYRSGQAGLALADAMRTYETPVVAPGRPVPAGIKTFASDEDRARAATAEFAAIAGRYGMTPAGRNARYLQGVTALQAGQTATAEGLLKKSGWFLEW